MEKILPGLLNERSQSRIPNIVYTEKTNNTYEKIVQINQKLWMYFGSIVLLLAIVGNSFTLCVLCRKRMRKMVVGVYLITLTTSDLITALTAVLRMWMFFLFGVDYFGSFPPLCKPLIFLQNFSKLCTSWMVVIITLERTVLVCRPLMSVGQRPCFLTPVSILITICIVLALVVIPQLYYVEVQDEICITAQNYFRGDSNGEFAEALHYILYSFIPSLIIIPCSLIIVFKLYNSKWGYMKSVKHLWCPSQRVSVLPTVSFVSVWIPPSLLARMSSSESTIIPRISSTPVQELSPTTRSLPILDQILKSLPLNAYQGPSLTHSIQCSNSRAYLPRNRLCRLRHNIRIVLIINAIFLVTTTPLCIIRFLLLFDNSFNESSKYNLYYASQIATLFAGMNLIIDLVLFIASGKAFRNELKTLEPKKFRRKKDV